MKGLILLSLTITALCLSTVCYAQPDVVLVRLTQPPPNQLRIADLWKVELNNMSGGPLRVFLHGTAEEFSIPDDIIADATTRIITLQPGRTIVNGNDVQPVKVNKSKDRYRESLLRTGTVPTGDYEICVEVVAEGTEEVLGRDCKRTTVNRTSQPILITPFDEAEVLEKYPVFTWMASVPPSPGQTMLYRMRLVEIFGRQTAADAMVRNPAWLEVGNLSRTLYQYPVSARGFVVGQRYAWKISAYELARSTEIPLGESEIWWFTYKPLTVGDDNGATKRGDVTTAPELTTECPGENWDFEIGSLACWTVEGDAFADDPQVNEHLVLGTNGHHAKYWVSSYGFYNADKARGAMLSEEVQLKNNTVGFLFGGSNDREATVELLIERQPKDTFKLATRSLPGNPKGWWVAYSTYGKTNQSVTERMNPVDWDVTKYLNRSARIFVRDSSQTAHVNFDYFRFYDKEPKDKIKLPVLVMAAGENHSLVATPDEKPTTKELTRYAADVTSIKAGSTSIRNESVVNETSPLLKGQFESAFLAVQKSNPGITQQSDNASYSMPNITDLAVDKSILANQAFLALAVVNPNNIVWGWGDNELKAVVNSYLASVKEPTVVSKVKNVQALAAGMDQSFAVEKGGLLKGWGYNDYGQLGVGDRNSRSDPTILAGITNVASVATGSRNSYAVTTAGDVYVWGYNRTFELGIWVPFYVNATTGQIDSIAMAKKPLKHAAFKNCKAVAAGEAHGLALTAGGLIYSWGVNGRGQTGHDDDDEFIVWPTALRIETSRSPIAAIAAGADHSLALTRDGKVYAWGGNASGQLGDGTTKDRNKPTVINQLSSIRAISAGEGFSLALDSAGVVWAWGNNVLGQLGDGTRIGKFAPVKIVSLEAVQGIVAGGAHAMAVQADGSLWTWGTNQFGQLGEGPISNIAPVPLELPITPTRVERLATAP